MLFRSVRVGTAVSGALDEGDVIGIYNLFPLCKALDGFWKTCQYIRDLDPSSRAPDTAVPTRTWSTNSSAP